MINNLSLDEQALIYLDYLQIGRKRIEALMALDGGLYKQVISPSSFCVKEILGSKQQEVLKYEFDKTISKILKYLEDNFIGAITILSENYPENLKHISPVPFVLYYKGDLSLTKNENILGIVGTRKPTRYGRWAAEEFSSSLAKNGIITISGLAYGIDSEVARNTISVGGKTIAVLGGGINEIYPSSNEGLARSIVRNGGLILSEYFPSFKPTKYTFPERNRIISGLSRGLLVIEAGLGSGSLITANLAIEQGKDLFVVPGNIDSKESMGSNKLIAELPSTFTHSPDQILDTFGLKKEYEKEYYQCSFYERRVLDAVNDEPKSFDELCEILKEDSKNLNLLLTEMEISGIIKKLPGNYYGT